MTMTTKKLMLAALLACAFAPALADAVGGAAETRIERRIVTSSGQEIKLEVGGPGEHPMFFPGMQINAGKLVKSAPYSAEVVTERQQNLADGNQIVNTSRALSYRDSAGRTRHEMRDAEGELRSVTIRDAEGATYILNPRQKTATRLAANPYAARAAREYAQARVEALRKQGKLPALERKGADGDGQAKLQQDVRVRIATRAAGEHGGIQSETTIHLGPTLAGAFNGMKWAAQATTKDLGTREFDGIKAAGKLRSYEIPAGEIGNRNPIVVSSEFWYSPELQVTVYSKHSDPRSGDFVYRLDNVKRDEPAAALFTVPSDYAVKDVMANVTKRLERKAE
jgi:hypothetical protein